ncbi:MAG: hypothetical protein FJX74_00600 [Armatimonadetes bacterium]|nr:hypothetical protein [Armatimonadota bacterium]
MQNRSALYAGGCVIGVAIILLLFGLIFLLGSQGKPAIILTGVIMVAVGIAAGVFAIRKLGQITNTAPDTVDQRILNLATMSGGEVTAAEVVGALMIPVADAQRALERLVSQGLAEHKVRGDDLYYAFPGIATVRKTKRCAYCGAEYPLREPGHKCPACGGILEVVEAKE